MDDLIAAHEIINADASADSAWRALQEREAKR